MKVETMECYIMNMNTKDVVSFNIEIPEEVSDSYTAEYEDQSPRGRSSPFKSYTNSGPRSVNFSVMLALDYRRDLKETVECLRNMLKPDKKTAIIPPKVKVKIGNIIDIYAVPMSFDVVWSNGYRDGVYRTCECSFAFDEVEDKGTFTKGSGKKYVAVAPKVAGARVTKTSATNLDYGDEVVINTAIKGYYTSDEAIIGKSSGNPISDVKPGTYYVYNKSKGMVNISTAPGVPGSWVNIGGDT